MTHRGAHRTPLERVADPGSPSAAPGQAVSTPAGKRGPALHGLDEEQHRRRWAWWIGRVLVVSAVAQLAGRLASSGVANWAELDRVLAGGAWTAVATLAVGCCIATASERGWKLGALLGMGSSAWVVGLAAFDAFGARAGYASARAASPLAGLAASLWLAAPALLVVSASAAVAGRRHLAFRAYAVCGAVGLAVNLRFVEAAGQFRGLATVVILAPAVLALLLASCPSPRVRPCLAWVVILATVAGELATVIATLVLSAAPSGLFSAYGGTRTKALPVLGFLAYWLGLRVAWQALLALSLACIPGQVWTRTSSAPAPRTAAGPAET